MNNNKKDKTLFDQLLSRVPSDITKFVQKQGEIAVQIGTILKKKGMTQKEFAKLLDMKESQLSKILSGNANCTLKTITKIENALREDIIIIPLFREEFTYNTRTDISYTANQFVPDYDIDNYIEFPEDILIKQQNNVNFMQYSDQNLVEVR